MGPEPTIRNVVIVVIDGLRWDALPQSVADEGVVCKGVAASLNTVSSLTSLFTGLYPPQHGTHNWKMSLSGECTTIFDIESVDSGYQGPVADYGAVGEIVGDTRDIPSLSPPFLYVHHSHLTHIPYGPEESGGRKYLSERPVSRERIRADYRENAERSGDVLRDVQKKLTDAGVLDETLIVFTSDHGELLGEHGSYTHNAPVCPELVYVPIVFMHPSVDESTLAIDPETDVVEHVDITGTALARMGADTPSTMGTDVFETPRSRPTGYNYVRHEHGGLVLYESNSLWDYGGGHVFLENPRRNRLLYYGYQLWRGPAKRFIRRHPIRTLRGYALGDTIYGTPETSRAEAKETIAGLESSLSVQRNPSAGLDDDMKERLHDLGYRM